MIIFNLKNVRFVRHDKLHRQHLSLRPLGLDDRHKHDSTWHHKHKRVPMHQPVKSPTITELWLWHHSKLETITNRHGNVAELETCLRKEQSIWEEARTIYCRNWLGDRSLLRTYQNLKKKTRAYKWTYKGGKVASFSKLILFDFFINIKTLF